MTRKDESEKQERKTAWLSDPDAQGSQAHALSVVTAGPCLPGAARCLFQFEMKLQIQILV